MTKYILVSGGVISGIGKGVIASSTGLLLKTTGLKVTAIKIDPYMNIDAGTMAPTEHGEFVLPPFGFACSRGRSFTHSHRSAPSHVHDSVISETLTRLR